MPRRSFSTDFKHEAAGLVLAQGYSVPEACKSMDVGPAALRRWVERLRGERGDTIRTHSRAKAHTRLRGSGTEREKEMLKRLV